MKRIIFLLSLVLVGEIAFPAEKSSVLNDVFNSHAVQKVEYAQSIIKFSDEQAKQLVALEYQFLLNVQKAEKCCLCNTRKRVEKLKTRKYEAVAKILAPNEFIKYKAIDNKEIKKRPLWAE